MCIAYNTIYIMNTYTWVIGQSKSQTVDNIFINHTICSRYVLLICLTTIILPNIRANMQWNYTNM